MNAQHTFHITLHFIVFCLTISQCNALEHPFVLLQTFGTTHHPGRIVAGNSERGITLQLAEHISTVINEGPEGVEALIVNPAGKNQNNLVETFNKINQLRHAVVIKLTACQNTKQKPSCSIFFRCYNPLTDQIKRPMAPLTPIPLEDVYLTSFNASKTLAKNLTSHMLAASQNVFDVKNSAGIPLANVRGIRHPVIHIEAHIDQAAQITQLGDFLADSIKQMIAS